MQTPKTEWLQGTVTSGFVIIATTGVIGAVLIVCGLYMVLWGKSKEMKTATQLVSSSDNTVEFGVTEVVVVSTTENSDRDNNSHINCT
ncbi:hypothetical protein JHK82_023555 [Glycine max]|nr:hypothetical protein JHK85_024025 [Glycine max]KAG5027700.1 hypothetical protein JHK86_023614 [Glycine max]KAG5138824.1 hypothetical protein JHK82_023555 [Glycine max]